MISFIKIETASLVFACLSMLGSTAVSLFYMERMVRVCIAMAKLISSPEDKNVNSETMISSYGLHVNTLLAIYLSMALIGLAFSIILTKGLVSKRSYLVKSYFIYGVTMETLLVLIGLYITTTINVKVGLIYLFGFSLHILILVVIKKTYLKLAINEQNECSPKEVVAEKSISIKI